LTLANMRENGVRSLSVTCEICHHEALMNVDAFDDSIPVPAFGPRMVCTGCGIVGTDARPNWTDRTVAAKPHGSAMERLTDDERRLLELLATSANGVSDALLGLAHGFTLDMMAGLVRERLATATLERTFAGGKPVEVTRVRITDAGRRALAWTARNKK
jgi:hypothetical protein